MVKIGTTHILILQSLYEAQLLSVRYEDRNPTKMLSF